MTDIVYRFKIEGTDETAKSLKEVDDELNDVNQSLKDLNQTKGKNQKLTEEEIKKYQDLKKRQLALREARQKGNKTLKDEIKLNKTNANTLNNISAKLSKAQKEFKDLTIGTAAYIKKAKEIKDLEQIQRDANEELGRGSTFVGEYAKGFKEATAGLGAFSSQLGGINPQILQLGSGLLSSTKAVTGTTKGLKFFKIALISIGIGAIIVGLGTLIGLFLKTTEGTNKLAVALAKIKGAITAVVGSVAEFSKVLFTGGGLKEALKSFDGLNEKIKETAKSSGELAQNKIDYTKENRDIEKQISDLEERRKLLIDQAEDDTIGFLTRRKLYAEEAAAANELFTLRVKLAERNLELVTKEVEQRTIGGLKINAELLDQERDLQIELQRAKNEQLQVVRDSNELRRRSERDLWEYNLDVVIDTFDKIKTINEGQIKSENTSLDQKRQIFEETARLAELSYAKQIEITQEWAEKKIDFDSLVKESDATVIAKRLEALDLDDLTFNRSREIIQERKILLQDFEDSKTLIRQAEIKEIKDVNNEILNLNNELIEAQNQLIEDEFAIKKEQEIIKFEERKLVLEEQITELNELELSKNDELDAAKIEKLQALNDTLEAEEKGHQKNIEDIQKQSLKNQIKLYEARNKVLFTALDGIGEATAGFLTGQEGAFSNYLASITDQVIDSLVDSVNAKIIESTAVATIDSLSQPDSVATFGASGIARAAILTALITSAGQGVKSGIRSVLTAETGMMIPTGHELAGFPRNGDNTLVLAKPGELILNETQQRRVGMDNLRKANIPNFANGGLVPSVSQVQTIQNQSQQFTVEQIAILAQQVAQQQIKQTTFVASNEEANAINDSEIQSQQINTF